MEDLSIETIRRPRLSDRVKQRLTQLILDQALKPGDELPSEGDLAERFGVSKPTVREALRSLAGVGLVEIAQGKRATVRNPSSEPLERFFRFAMTNSDQGLREVVELRRKLETEIAVLAAERATADQLARMEAAVAKMRDAVGTIEPWLDADLQLHMALAESAGNSLMFYLMEALGGVFRESMRILHLQRGPKGVEATLARHERIVQAVKSRDTQAVRQAMDAHYGAIDLTVMELDHTDTVGRKRRAQEWAYANR
jgi:GntR family transcriptional repressor for pyruvate dehydrogenase complex